MYVIRKNIYRGSTYRPQGGDCIAFMKDWLTLSIRGWMFIQSMNSDIMLHPFNYAQ
jgi:hypothetical protein